MLKTILRIALCLLVLVPAGVLAWWWLQFRSVRVETHTVQAGDLLVGVTVSGIIRAKEKTAISAEIVAPVRRLAVAEGKTVGKDDVLVELDDSVVAADCARARAQVDVAKHYLAELKAGSRKEEVTKSRELLNQAQARFVQADQHLKKLTDLVGRGAITQSELEEGQANFKVAQSELAAAKASLDLLLAGARPEEVARAEAEVRLAEAGLAKGLAQQAKYTLRAPHTKMVTVRDIHMGEITSPGQVLMRLDNVASLEVRAQVQESQLRGIQLGDVAEVLADAYPEHPIEAKVAQILPRVDEETGTVVVLLEFSGKPPVALMDGMAVDVALIREHRKDVLRVPAEAVDWRGKHAYVQRQSGGSFVRREIQPGIRNDMWVEVRSGLQAGDVVRLR